MSRKLLLCLLFSLISATTIVFANTQPITQIDLIFDASNSMWGQIDGKAKIEIARTALNELLKEFNGKKHIYLGLRVYGHLNKRCDNSVLEIKPGANNIEAIRKKVAKIKPLGKTPIAYSLQMAAKDFDKNLPGKKIIILITDGLESCGGNPCVAAGILKKAGIITKIHVVGFGLKEKALASLDCIAKPFGGKVIGANNTKELINAFKEISKAVAIENNLRVVGLDKNQKPVEINVKVTNQKTQKQAMGTNVSFTLDKGTYKVTAISEATAEAQEKEAVDVVKEKATEVKFQFKQGYLILKSIDGNNKEIYAKYQFFKNEKEIANNEGKNKVKQILLPGKYDVKATNTDLNKTLWQKNIEIIDGKATSVTFKFSDAKFVLSAIDDNDKITYALYKIYKSETKEEIKSDEGNGKIKVILVPGKYDIKSLNNDIKAELWEKNIELKAGETIEKQFKFTQGKFVFNSVDGSGKTTYALYKIYKSETKDEAKGDEGIGKVKMTLVPGKYDIKVYHSDTKAEQWEKDIELKGGETIEKQFKFTQGKFVFNSIDGNGKPTYALYRIYKSGTKDEAKGDEGVGNVKMTLVPGKYDIKAYHSDTKTEKWEKNIELKDGETLEKQFKF